MSNQNNRNRKTHPRLDHDRAPWRRAERTPLPGSVLSREELQAAVAEMLG